MPAAQLGSLGATQAGRVSNATNMKKLVGRGKSESDFPLGESPQLFPKDWSALKQVASSSVSEFPLVTFQDHQGH